MLTYANGRRPYSWDETMNMWITRVIRLLHTLVPVQLTFMYELWSTQFNIFPRGEIQGKKLSIPVTWAGCHSKSKTLSVQIKAPVVQMIQIVTMLYYSHILTTTGEPHMIELWRWVKLMGVFGWRRAASWHRGGLQGATVHSSGQ